MTNSLINHGITYGPLFILSSTFLVAGSIKLIDPLDFSNTLTHYPLLPIWSIAPIAIILPVLELCCAAALWYQPLRQAAFCILSAMLLIFLSLIITVIIQGQETNCGCWENYSSNIGWPLLLFDSFLLMLTLMPIFKRNPQQQLTITSP